MKHIAYLFIFVPQVIIYSCAPTGLTPEERVTQFVSDVQTNGASLGHNFNSAAEMYHDVHDLQKSIDTIFNNSLSDPSLLTILSAATNMGDNLIDILLSDGGNNWAMQFQLEYELYSPFTDDYKIRRIDVVQDSMITYVGFY